MKMTKTKANKNQSGVVLILTLWIVVILSLIAYSFSYEMQLETSLTKLRKENMYAYGYARAGVARAILNLKNDLIFDQLGGIERPCDSNDDIWGKNSKEYKENMLNGTVSEGKKRKRKSDKDEEEEGFRVRVIDEASKLPLNTSSAILLKYALMTIDVEKEDAEFLANAIVDWRDEDIIVESGLGSNENDYYSEEVGYPVVFKNDRFATVEELLDVPGMTPEIFYGTREDDFYNFDSSKKLRRTKKEKEGIIGLKDMVTVCEDKVNINTASREVLTAIASVVMLDAGKGKDVADTIINFRDGTDPEDSDDDELFKDVQDLSRIPGIPPSFTTIILMTTFARNFTVESIGYCGEAQKSIITVVSRNWEVHQDVTQLVALDKDKDSEQSQNLGEPKVRILIWRED